MRGRRARIKEGFIKEPKPSKLPAINRQTIFARYFDGSIASTVARMSEDGYSITKSQGEQYARDPDVQNRILAIAESRKGVLTRDELKAFWSRIVLANEPIGYKQVKRLGNTLEDVPIYPDLPQRIKASELLARAQGMFIERVEHSGGIEISILSLLDDDLKPVIDVKPSLNDDELLT